MTEQPHDHLFRLTFASPENALGILRAVLPPEVMAAIDPGSLELEEGSFVDKELRGQESDLLFRARLRGGRTIKIYILVEHQSTVDPRMPFRLLRYVVSIQDRWLRDSDPRVKLIPAVIPIVFFHGPKPWNGPRSVEEIVDLPADLRPALAPYMPAFSLLIDDLAAQAEASLVMRQAGILGRLAFVFLKAAMDGSDLLVTLDRMRPFLVELTRSSVGRDGLVLIVRYIMKVREIEPRTLVEQVQRALAEVPGEVPMATTYDQILEEGALAQLRRTLLRLLEKRFGAVPDTNRRHIADASKSDLERWLDQILTAPRLEDVFAKR